MVCYYLEYVGWKLTMASDGPCGEAGFRRQRPQLAIHDLMLPGFDGLELCL